MSKFRFINLGLSMIFMGNIVYANPAVLLKQNNTSNLMVKSNHCNDENIQINNINKVSSNNVNNSIVNVTGNSKNIELKKNPKNINDQNSESSIPKGEDNSSDNGKDNNDTTNNAGIDPTLDPATNSVDIRFNKLRNEKKENNEIELVFIIDRSGSMCSSAKEVIEGFNDLISKQKNIQDGKVVRLTTVVFNTHDRVLHNRTDIQGISCITENDYKPHGGTALLDAVGNTISSIKDKNGKRDVMCVIMTDGLENSSRKFSYADIKNLIAKKQQQGNWKFSYYLSGIELDEKSDIGISPDDTVCCDSVDEDEHVFKSVMKNSCAQISGWRESKKLNYKI